MKAICFLTLLFSLALPLSEAQAKQTSLSCLASSIASWIPFLDSGVYYRSGRLEELQQKFSPVLGHVSQRIQKKVYQKIAKLEMDEYVSLDEMNRLAHWVQKKSTSLFPRLFHLKGLSVNYFETQDRVDQSFEFYEALKEHLKENNHMFTVEGGFHKEFRSRLKHYYTWARYISLNGLMFLGFSQVVPEGVPFYQWMVPVFALNLATVDFSSLSFQDYKHFYYQELMKRLFAAIVTAHVVVNGYAINQGGSLPYSGGVDSLSALLFQESLDTGMRDLTRTTDQLTANFDQQLAEIAVINEELARRATESH